MLFKNACTCIKTNGFISKYFSISRSCRQGCPIAPLLYILQAEPMACAIREDNQIKGINLPGNVEGEMVETKLCMFADDTQLFNKNDESVKKSFEILETYEKASGSRVNYKKTKGLRIGISKHRKSKFTKIDWIKGSVKTLGIMHGYNIQDEEIWKSIIEKIKNCIQVWKTRNLTYTGKSLIVKNLLLSLCGYEAEMRGIPEKFEKEICSLIWEFIWGGKTDLVERLVCYLPTDLGGLGMINLKSFFESKQIKLIYRIIHEPLQSWNAIGKYWLRKLDNVFNDNFFSCRCTDINARHLNKLPVFYRKALIAWSKFYGKLQSTSTANEILKQRLFCNKNITFQNKPLMFTSFLNQYRTYGILRPRVLKTVLTYITY